MKSFMLNEQKATVPGKGACTDLKIPRAITPHGNFGDTSRWQQPSLPSRHVGARSVAVAAPECPTATLPSIRPGTNRTLQCVDISDFENRKEEIVRNLMAAADIGFFYITGHGIPQELTDEAFAANKRFLTSPSDIKMKKQQAKVVGDVSESQAYILGYSRERNSAATLRESFLASYESYPLMADRWPDEEDAPGYRDTLLRFMRANHVVVERVMRAFALGLDLPEDFFVKEMDINDPENGTTMNNNYYPSLENVDLPPGTLRIYSHCDYEVLSLLHTRPGETGLEVCPSRDVDVENVQSVMATEWTDMDPIPGAITVNMGDSLHYWSDGRLKANFHRVRYPRPGEYKGERQSIAYFANARVSTVFQGPLKSYPPITFAQIMEQKRGKDLPVNPEQLDPVDYVRWQNGYVMGPEIPADQVAQ